MVKKIVLFLSFISFIFSINFAKAPEAKLPPELELIVEMATQFEEEPGIMLSCFKHDYNILLNSPPDSIKDLKIIATRLEIAYKTTIYLLKLSDEWLTGIDMGKISPEQGLALLPTNFIESKIGQTKGQEKDLWEKALEIQGGMDLHDFIDERKSQQSTKESSFGQEVYSEEKKEKEKIKSPLLSHGEALMKKVETILERHKKDAAVESRMKQQSAAFDKKLQEKVAARDKEWEEQKAAFATLEGERDERVRKEPNKRTLNQINSIIATDPNLAIVTRSGVKKLRITINGTWFSAGSAKEAMPDMAREKFKLLVDRDPIFNLVTYVEECKPGKSEGRTQWYTGQVLCDYSEIEKYAKEE